MRPWPFKVAALLIILGFVWLTTQTSQGAADPVWRRVQATGVLIVGTDIGYAPFVEQGPDGALQGYDVALVEELGRRLGVRIEWRQVGYDALFSAIDPGNANHVDLLAAGIVRNPGEGWRARFSQPYFDNGLRLAIAPGAAASGDLSGAVVAVQLGSGGDSIARSQEAGRAWVVDNRYETQAAALDALAQGTANAAIVDNLTYTVGENLGQAQAIETLTTEPIVLVVPAHAYQLHAEIDALLAELQAEGFIGALNANLR